MVKEIILKILFCLVLSYLGGFLHLTINELVDDEDEFVKFTLKFFLWIFVVLIATQVVL